MRRGVGREKKSYRFGVRGALLEHVPVHAPQHREHILILKTNDSFVKNGKSVTKAIYIYIYIVWVYLNLLKGTSSNHSGLRGLPCLAEGIYWATGLSRTTPFTEGRLGVNNKASPPGHHQEKAPKQRCTFRPTTFSSVQLVHGKSLLM